MSYVVFERQVLLREEKLLDMDVTEAAQESFPHNHFEGQHGRIVAHPGGGVRHPAASFRSAAV